MKKLLLAVALIASLNVAGAQQVRTKTPNAARAAVEAAKAETANAKKAANAATWIKLGQAYLEAYNASVGSGWKGATRTELQLIMANVKATDESQETLNGQTMTKVSYPGFEYFFNAAGALEVVNITKPVIENALDEAFNAFKKAAELDVKGKKSADISDGIKDVVSKMADYGIDQYTLGNYEFASKLFEGASIASATKPYDEFDPLYLYNAAFTAFEGNDFQRAKDLFTQCLENGSDQKDGEIYSHLATIETKLGNAEASKKWLEEGFTKFPTSQSILVGLINYYMSSGEDSDRLFSLINEAKKNEPNNASLYYVEGNINKELGKTDEAIAAYRKCAEINPKYEFGYVGEGILLYEQAAAIQEEAQNELDDAKYMALVEKFDAALKGCITPFEKAFEVSADESVKAGIAEYLKNAYYRFREESASYQQGYDKYSKYLSE